MSKPMFLLVGKVCLEIYRVSKGTYVKGIYQEGQKVVRKIQANVQPMKMEEIMLLPEAERGKEALRIYSASELRAPREGTTDAYDSDQFEWEGDTYRIMKVQRYKMGVLDHYKAIAVRLEIAQEVSE